MLSLHLEGLFGRAVKALFRLRCFVVMCLNAEFIVGRILLFLVLLYQHNVEFLTMIRHALSSLCKLFAQKNRVNLRAAS